MWIENEDNWDLIKVTHIILWINVDNFFLQFSHKSRSRWGSREKAALSGNPGWIVKKILNNFGKKYLTK